MPSDISKTPKVKPFLEVRLKRVEAEADLLGLCAGFESGSWRADAFARALIRNLPQFVLPVEDWQHFNSATGVEQLSRAARAIYTTGKYQNRGEVGELILFSIMREHYDSEPIISKFYFKSSSNDTVKGFDSVHVVENKKVLELWLGEVKFYTSISAAIRDVLAELRDHLSIDFLREEFMWIDNKMSDKFIHATRVRRLLDDSTSLDQVFEVMHIPILLTYKSPIVCRHSTLDDTYVAAIRQELSQHFDTFRAKGLPSNVKIISFLFRWRAKRAYSRPLTKGSKPFRISRGRPR